MDYNLRRKTILLTILAGVTVVLVLIYANIGKLQKDDNNTTVSASQGETVVLVEGQNTGYTVSYQQVGDDTSHWKNDETFFDNEKDTLAMHLMEQMSTLSLGVVSVERDIRVRVVDYQGNLKTGETFEIVARGEKSGIETVMSDDDKDGVIYFDDIAPGEYSVFLRPIEGYVVPDCADEVTVRDCVEYSLIEDISLLMIEEGNINSEREDTMVVTAEAAADKSMSKTYGKDPATVYGIDVSSANGTIDWNEVYKSGIRFVMLRAGYRGSDSGQIIIDSAFYSNAKMAIYAGLDVGAFFFSQAVTEAEAVEEASALLTITSDINLSLPLTIRLDMAGGSGRADELSSERRTDIANAFCQTIRNFGKQACIYASANWLNTNIDYNVLDKNLLWLADYREIPTYEGYFDLWQYSCKGKVGGVDGDVSLNISYVK